MFCNNNNVLLLNETQQLVTYLIQNRHIFGSISRSKMIISGLAGLEYSIPLYMKHLKNTLIIFKKIISDLSLTLFPDTDHINFTEIDP